MSNIEENDCWKCGHPKKQHSRDFGCTFDIGHLTMCCCDALKHECPYIWYGHNIEKLSHKDLIKLVKHHLG